MGMKLNIAYSANGTQKCTEMTTKEEQRLYGKKVGEQFDGEIIGEEFKGSILEITGGNDHQGFCMVRDKDTPKRLKLLLKAGDVGYRCKRKGVRKRKTVRGSIVSNETQVLNLMLVKENKPIEGLTDAMKPKSHLPKKITKLCKEFGLDPSKDVISQLKVAAGDQKLPRVRIVRKISENQLKKREAKKALRV